MFVTDQGLNRTVPLGFLIRYFSDANVGGTTAAFFSHCSKCSTAQKIGSEDASLMRGPGNIFPRPEFSDDTRKIWERFLLGIKMHCVEVKQQASLSF
jgi:hypothetical protein